METPSSTPPPIRDRRTPPSGVLPKNIQAWLLIGVATAMVLAMALTGGKTVKTSSTLPPANSAATDPNAARIQEYQARLEEQTRKLQLEQAQLSQTPALLGGPLSPEADAPRVAGTPDRSRDWIREDRAKRDYESLFAPNVALSYRKFPDAVPGGTIPPDGPGTPPAAPLSLPLPLLRSSNADRSTSVPPVGVLPATPPPPTTVPPAGVVPKVTTRSPATYRLFEGTFLETVLTNRLDGSFSGPVNAMVTMDVYSAEGRHLLIPRGSRVLGEAQRVETLGQQRLAVVFHRLLLPNGFSIDLDGFQGLNQIGETGLRDRVDHHYLQVFGVSLAVGAIAGLGPARTAVETDQAPSGEVAGSLSQSALKILDRFLNVLPTFTIREGHRIKVYLAGDLIVPAYENRPVPIEKEER